jgi:hypothetical protein
LVAGGTIQQLTVTCQGNYSRVIGLIRLGKQKEDRTAPRAGVGSGDDEEIYISSI